VPGVSGEDHIDMVSVPSDPRTEKAIEQVIKTAVRHQKSLLKYKSTKAQLLASLALKQKWNLSPYIYVPKVRNPKNNFKLQREKSRKECNEFNVPKPQTLGPNPKP